MADEDAQPPAAAAIDSKVLDSITHWRSFSSVVQVHESKDGHASSPARIVTVYTLIGNADNATVYLGTVESPRRQVTLEQAKQSLARISDAVLYPVLPPQLQAHAVTSLPESSTAYYLKRPKILNYRHNIGTAYLADQLLEEAHILNQLRQNAHPNLGVCAGYWTPPGKGGRMAGIVLRRYKTTLHDHVKSQQPQSTDDHLDPEQAEEVAAVPAARYMEQLRAAVGHLHSMGLAHNDINPRNVMLDDDDNIVLIDLGSCKPLGEALSEFGTPPFNEGFTKSSSQRNDDVGLTEIQKWLGLPVAKVFHILTPTTWNV